jgi:hypothetical protein
MEERAVRNVVEKLGESVIWVQGKKFHCYGLKIGRASM